MTDLQRDLDGARAAHALLDERLAGLTDAQVGAPSLLPTWTVGHVLTHIARNAEGMQRMVDAAAFGEVGAMYPGGLEQRTADIAAGAARPAAELVADVRATNAALEIAWDALDASGWELGVGETVFGPIPISDVPWRRWREATIHHADLGLGYTWAEWPEDFVRLELARMTVQWASRTSTGRDTLPPEAQAVPDVQRLAWLFGRADIATLPPANVM
ncbi:MAG: hypothetical protein JWM12_128 [Ilumatobacteraceae bacterium]|nr:hypothetical protein [Ilumatobacteraceae bacterium]